MSKNNYPMSTERLKSLNKMGYSMTAREMMKENMIVKLAEKAEIPLTVRQVRKFRLQKGRLFKASFKK